MSKPTLEQVIQTQPVEEAPKTPTHALFVSGGFAGFAYSEDEVLETVSELLDEGVSVEIDVYKYSTTAAIEQGEY